MTDDKKDKLDLDDLEMVAGGSAIDAINQAVADTRNRPGDSLQYPYGAAPFNSTPVNPGVVSPGSSGPLKTDF